MKKIITLLLVVVLAFSATITIVSAAESPTAPTIVTEPGKFTLEELRTLYEKVKDIKDVNLQAAIVKYLDLIENGGTPEEIDKAYEEILAMYNEYLNSLESTDPTGETKEPVAPKPVEPTSPQTGDELGLIATCVLVLFASVTMGYIARKKIKDN